MTTPSLATIKAQLADLAGIDALSMQILVGRHNYQFGGKLISVDPTASADEIASEIRAALSSQAKAMSTPGANSASLLPSVGLPSKQENRSMTTAPAPGSFAAGLKAMMDEARAGVAKARADGLATVQQAVGKLNEAKAATEKVAGSMAKTIEDEAAAVLSELGQISNDLGGGNG